jgi:hypothetical protein
VAIAAIQAESQKEVAAEKPHLEKSE